MAASHGSWIRIGDYTRVAHFVSVKTSTHKIDPQGLCIGGKCFVKDIVIGSGCWLCAGAIILPGVVLGDKCVVAAGAVVTRNINNYELAAGVPATIRKKYE